jgi:PPM family protein phosphatase
MLRAIGITDRGRVRPTNEDCFAIDSGHQLCVVADGMGGHNAGEVASRLAVDTVVDFVVNRAVATTWPYGYDEQRSEVVNVLQTAVQLANARVFEQATLSPECAGMGTTLVVVMVKHNVATVVHVGDSRVYTFADRHVQQITDDDSWTAVMLARDPDLSPDVIRRHPMRNALTSVVGSKSTVEVHVYERTLRAGELLLLTTDGVHGVLGQDDLVHACDGATDVGEIAAGLVRSAMEMGSRDNCTAVVAQYTRD